MGTRRRFAGSVWSSTKRVHDLAQVLLGIGSLIVTVVTWKLFGTPWGVAAAMACAVVILTATGFDLQRQLDAVIGPMEPGPPVEWNTWDHEQAVEVARRHLAEGEALRDEAMTRLDPSSTKRRAQEWEAETSDDLRRYDQSWVVLFKFNTFKLINPADSHELTRALNLSLARLSELIGD